MAVFSFNHNQEKLFALLEQLAAAVCEASLIVVKFTADFAGPEYNLRLIKSVKKRGYKILSLIWQQTSRQFVLPFDPEDILLLARELNTCLSYIAAIMEKIVVYQVYPLKDAELLAMITVLDNTVREIYQVIARLHHLRAKRMRIRKKCQLIKYYQQLSDSHYLSGTGSLFNQANLHVLYFLKLKEIYVQTELAINSCGELSDTVNEMTVKYV